VKDTYTKLILPLVLLAVFMSSWSNIKSQGCSDAGTCSIGSLNHSYDSIQNAPKFKFSYEQSFGLGEKFMFISTTSFIAEHRFTKTTSWVVKIPFIIATGNLGNSTGVGDLYVSVIQELYKSTNSNFGILIGGKLRTSKSDFKFGNRPLPMAYQSSLGTYDVITGVQYINKTWDFYLAYQHPFGRNQNQYLHPEDESNKQKLYFESAYLKRGDDLALKVQKTFSLKKEQRLLVGVLPLLRLQKSEIIRNDQPELLDGSDGLTLNIYLTFSKTLKNNTIIDITGASAAIDRNYRADGLTRNFILTLRFTNFF
jgi:hypothetical protein